MTAVRVVETAEGIMGPFAGQLLLQAGYGVTKLEGVHGDWARSLGPFPEGTERRPDSDPGGLYEALNRGKTVKRVDLASVGGRDALRHLIESADVLLCGPELDAAGITGEMPQVWNPSLIRTFVSPLPRSGDYARYATTCIQVLALGGIMAITGEPEREPLQIPGHHPDFIGGLHTFTAVNAALVRRERSRDRGGERVEVSALESVAATAEMVCSLYTFQGAVRSRFYGRQPWGIQGEVMRCKDGYVGVHPGVGEMLALVIGRPDLVGDPLFSDGIYRLRHAEEFFDILRPYLESHTRREIVEDCQALRVPFGAVLEVGDLLQDEQLRATNYFEPVTVAGQTVDVPGPVYRTRLVAHGDGVIAPRPRIEVATARPLEGIRVIDLSWVWAGPSGTRILADLGADVIKIEAPHRPDSVRALVQDGNISHPDYWNRGGYFIEKNLGKRSLTLNLASPNGVDVFKRLLEQADVVVESFSPRVMEQLGLGFERIAAMKPGIIMVSLSGYGQAGPARDRVAYGAALEPEAGITATIGYEGGPPVKSGLAYTDPLSGVVAAGAVLAALRERLAGETADSIHIDLAEREVVIPFITDRLIDFQLNGRTPSRRGNRHLEHWPQGCYPCAGHDRWIVITVRSDEEWDTLAGLVGAPELRGLALDDRRSLVNRIDALIREFCCSRDPYSAMRLLQAYGVPSAVVQNGRDLYHDAELRARGFFTAVDHPLVGVKDYPSFLGATFERSIVHPAGPAPLLDQNSEEVLGELGYSPTEIRAMRDEGTWGHHLVEGSRPNLALPLDDLLALGAVSGVDPLPAPLSMPARPETMAHR